MSSDAAVPATPGLTPGLVPIMSVATGLAVAGNYYAQPLLPAIAREMGLSAAWETKWPPPPARSGAP